MSNEYKDWINEKYSDVLFETGVIDNVLYTVYLGDWCAVVHGTLNGIHQAYSREPER